ncbi:uncharacterized protein (DUF58 family) [Granulicella aggregans]|uniref:Uncharacterized protein (DUF58 family) n=1 Tax=Granulicella aggregans TaxID=474949 RepID=A0A7W8E4H3_9BACT|nr:DUF58 domain-containing protein [Granulicella aggregans]MBB5057140.1 uncharacterized protein (DUF58 family) [Granulicella aggregans]
MQTLIPQQISAKGRTFGRMGRVVGFGITARGLWLLLAGLLFSVPEFFHPHRLWIMLAWDGLIALLIFVDGARLPSPAKIVVSRRFVHSPAIGQATEIEFEVVQESNTVVTISVTDDLHPALIETPRTVTLTAFPRDAARASITVTPRERGDVDLGRIYLRCKGALGLIERWAVCDCEQKIRIFPSSEQGASDTELYLMRARQIELQKRRLRLRGIGREFESLRDYQRGDELRNISWTATARRAKLITRQFTAERSQQVWLIIDAGRLSRTAFELKCGSGQQDLIVTQLDQAATAALMLAQVISSSGDKFALLTYGRAIQQQLLPGNGPSHLRIMIDLLSQTKGERSEANHLNAVSRLKNLQRRRGLVLWVTEMADSVGRPEVVTAASELVRRHLVVLVLLQHPELEALSTREPKNVEEMFASTAAQEILERRRTAILKLRQQGVLVVETTPGEVGAAAITKYLEVKAQGLI